MSKAEEWQELWDEALVAGDQAARRCVPTPMVVESRTAGEVKQYYVPMGVCGFANIRFKGNTSFGRWAKKTERATKSYSGGLITSVHVGGQSYEIKKAYAQAFAARLREGGVDDAYFTANLD